jgi:release factor glutamine methyltransferase
MPVETVEEALQRASFCLRNAQVENPRKEAELLLTWVTKRQPLQLLLEQKCLLPGDAAVAFWDAVTRRGHGEPMAYITGEKEFFGLIYKVNPNVLVPRPETEFVVEAALEWAETHSGLSGLGIEAVDLGTGSGILAVTLAQRLPAARIWAIDLSEKALKVAAENAGRHGVSRQITWCCGDFFQALERFNPHPRFNLLIGNPPYVRSQAIAALPAAVKDFEPALALDGGEDGLAAYRALLRDFPRYLLSPGLLALEIGAGQAEALENLCLELNLFRSITFRLDYQGWPRVLLGLF